MTKKTRKHGFTVVELVIVIAVIAILAAVLIPTYANLVKKANEATALAEAKNAITEMLANMLSADDASDIVVVSKKGSSAYIYGYSAGEGRIVEYKENPIDLNTNTTMLAETASYSKFFEVAQGLINNLKTNGALSGSTTSPTGWRDTTELNKEGGIIDQLGFKREEMAIFADVEIVVEKFETHTHTWDTKWTFDSTNHWHVCTSCGATDSKIAHSYTNGECVCGKVDPNYSTHTHEYNKQNVADEYVAEAATCDKAATYYYSCACGAKGDKTFGHGNALGHNWGDPTVTNATCTTDGAKTYTCTRCSKTKTETITKLGHKFEWTVTKKATCDEAGEKMETCSVCNATGKTEKIEATGEHSYSWATVTAATCEGNGSQNYICTKCKKVFDTKVIPATGHKFGEWEVTKKATCTENGSRTRKCTNTGCIKTESEVITATGHDYSDVAWTYYNEAYHTRKCKNCDTIASEAHTVSDGKCTVCNHDVSVSSVISVTDPGVLADWAKKELTADTVVRLDADMTLSKETIFNVKNQHVFILDLNGHKLTIDHTGAFFVQGDVTIRDTSIDRTGKIVAGSNLTGELITVRRTTSDTEIGSFGATNIMCTIENVTIDATAGGADACAIKMYNGGSVTVENGAEIIANGYAISGVESDTYSQGKLLINGGEITSNNSYAIYHPQFIDQKKDGIFEISGGTIKGKVGAIKLGGKQTGNTEINLRINGGILESNGDSIIYVNSEYLKGFGTNTGGKQIRIYVSGGTFNIESKAGFVKTSKGAETKGFYTYLKGGTFNMSQNNFVDTKAASNCLSSGYTIEGNNTTWSVVPKSK